MLFIALLPLQGWASASMSLLSAHQGYPGNMPLAASGVSSADSLAGHPCHTSAGDVAFAETDDEQTVDHAACQSCNICHGMAITAWPERPIGNEGEQYFQPGVKERFSSSDVRQDRKPPIS